MAYKMRLVKLGTWPLSVIVPRVGVMALPRLRAGVSPDTASVPMSGVINTTKLLCLACPPVSVISACAGVSVTDNSKLGVRPMIDSVPIAGFKPPSAAAPKLPVPKLPVPKDIMV